MRGVSELTSMLPHWKVPMVYLPEPKMRLLIYLDSELGVALNRREPEVTEAFSERVNPGSTVFDVGANIGAYSIHALASPETVVHAFEPHSDNAARLVENARHNGVEKRLFVRRCAVWRDTTDLILIEGSNPQTHRVSEEASDSTEGGTVQAVSIDDYCRDHDVVPDLMKVDVEGAADAVLAGADRLVNDESTIWLVEVHDTNERTAIEERFDDRYVVSSVSSTHFAITPSGMLR